MKSKYLVVAAFVCTLSGCRGSADSPPIVEPVKQAYGRLELTVRDGGGITPPGTTVELTHDVLKKTRVDTIPASGQLEINSIEAGRWTITVFTPPSYVARDPNKTKPADIRASETARVEFRITPIIGEECIGSPTHPC